MQFDVIVHHQVTQVELQYVSGEYPGTATLQLSMDCIIWFHSETIDPPATFTTHMHSVLSPQDARCIKITVSRSGV